MAHVPCGPDQPPGMPLACMQPAATLEPSKEAWSSWPTAFQCIFDRNMCMYEWKYIYIYIYAEVSMYICKYICVYVSICVYTYMRTHVHVCISVYIHIFTCAYQYLYVYIYIYIFLYMYLRKNQHWHCILQVHICPHLKKAFCIRILILARSDAKLP